MKILLAVDGSPCSEAAVKELENRPWPEGSEVKIVSVAHALPWIPEPTFTGVAAHYESLEIAKEHATKLLDRYVREIRDKVPGLRVTTEILEGPPKKVLVEEAERWRADLILVGSHGHGPVKRFVLGSVSHALALHAPCSVEIVRSREAINASAKK